MITKNNIQSIYANLPILGLLLLLLLSPCKVQNFIQVELGTSPAELSSKNKTTISNSSCSSSEIALTTLIKEKSKAAQYSPLPNLASKSLFEAIGFSNNQLPISTTRNYSISVIPLYILYKNFKVYL